MKMLFGQDDLVQAVLAKGIVEAWYPSMEGGNAIAHVLFGDVNPSGKLPFIFPAKLEDSPVYVLDEYPSRPGQPLKEMYKDDIYVGYRYYDTYTPSATISATPLLSTGP